MLIEIWSNLVSLLRTLLPMLSPGFQKNVKKIIDWAESQPNTHHGINQVQIDYVITFFDMLKNVLPKEWAGKVGDAQFFLKALNNGLNAEWIEHQGTCIWWGYFWYANACHVEPEPGVFDCVVFTNRSDCVSNGCYWYYGYCHSEPYTPPPPPPPVIPCRQHTTQNDCLSAGCYWWEGSCHDDPYTPPPPPPPPDVKCTDHKSEVECLTGGCYWWEGSCHDSPPVIPPGGANPVREFAKQVQSYCVTIPLTRPLEIVNCGILSGILNIAADVFDFLGKKR